MGSFLFAKMMGLENNIYLQTGLIMLIGLLAKTAILVTGYAVDRRKAGMSLIQSAVGGAKARFRPILMTVLAMIFGLLPLMFSSGAGANGNSSLGSGVVEASWSVLWHCSSSCRLCLSSSSRSRKGFVPCSLAERNSPICRLKRKKRI